jgi:hypothetical protein
MLTGPRSRHAVAHGRGRRSHERGSAMLVALIAVGGLITLGGMTVLSVQGGLTAVSSDRHRSAALYAAESGAAVGMNYLRAHVDGTTYWSAYVNPSNQPTQRPSEIPGNGILPGQNGNIFSADMVAWYEVEIVNNLEDTGYAAGNDEDKMVILRSTGHGPNGSTAQVEWRISPAALTGGGQPCPGYGQRGITEDGASRNDCTGTIVSGDVATYRPGS